MGLLKSCLDFFNESSWTRFFALGGLFILVFLVLSLYHSDGINAPLIGEPEGRKFFSLRTRLRYYLDCENLFKEAFTQVRTETNTGYPSSLLTLFPVVWQGW